MFSLCVFVYSTGESRQDNRVIEVEIEIGGAIVL